MDWLINTPFLMRVDSIIEGMLAKKNKGGYG